MKIQNISKAAAEIIVYNYHGKVVCQFQKQIGSRNYAFNSSNLEPGIYIIKLIQNGNVHSEKLIVSN